MLGIDGTGDTGAEQDSGAVLKAKEGVAPGRSFGRQVGSRDGDEAASGRETVEGAGEVAEGGVADAARDMGHDRERRVHEHDSRRDVGAQIVVDLRGVEAGQRSGGKQAREEIGAEVREFVERERSPGGLSEDGKKAGAGRGFENEIAGRDRGGGERGEAERQRRRELLEILTVLRPARMGRQKARDLGRRGQHAGGRSGLAQQRLAEFAQQQNRGDLAGFVGVFPVPGACCVGTAERLLHGRAQGDGVEALAALEGGKQQIRGGQNGRSGVWAR